MANDMDVYYVDVFGTCIGYVCADWRLGALYKAINALGFSWLGEYMFHYPGRFNNNSEILNLIKDDENYQLIYSRFVESDEHGNDFFILYVGKMDPETYHYEIYEDACFIRGDIPSSIMIVPKIEEIKKCDKFFDQFKLEDMWFCEDWIEK